MGKGRGERNFAECVRVLKKTRATVCFCVVCSFAELQ